MKSTTTTTTTLFAFFLLSAFISHLPSTTLADVVLDTDKEPLRNGGEYYILPVIRGNGGGIGPAATGNETCPLTVVQEPFELSKGLPIRIESPYRIAFILEGLIPLDLAFTAVPTCAPTPSKWTIVEGLPSEGPSVKLTGYGNTVDGWFKIEKSVLDYKLVFCAILTGSCSDIGVYHDDDGNRRLVATDGKPLMVQFQKVTSSSA